MVHRPNSDAFLARFETDLHEPSTAAFATSFILTGESPWPTGALATFASTRAEELRRGNAQPLPPVFDAALELCLARRLSQEGRAQDAVAAVARSVEMMPGDERLIAFEEQVRANSAGAAHVAVLDVKALLLDAPKTTGGDTAEAGHNPAENE